MGLFSVKTYTCTECGKQYSTRLDLGTRLCDDCLSELSALGDQVKGYEKYNIENGKTKQERLDIIAHREAILKANQPEHPVTVDELQYAAENYQALTDEQARSLAERLDDALLFDVLMGAFGQGLLAPDYWSGVVVDLSDVFAVGLMTARGITISGNDPILCCLFTNDPYIPLIPLLFSVPLKFLEGRKSVRGRQLAQKLFTKSCPNLRYPVQEMKDLKKEIKEEGDVRGNIEYKKMLSLIRELELGECAGKKLEKLADARMDNKTKEMLNQAGFYTFGDVISRMKLDKRAQRKFWNKQMEAYPEDEGVGWFQLCLSRDE